MKITLRQKIIILVLSLLFVVTLAASIISTMEIHKFYMDRIFNQMMIQLGKVEYLLETRAFRIDNTENYNLLAHYTELSRHRLTLIDSSGVVIFDSHVPLDSLHQLDNHINRPEIQMALEKSIGQNQRMSITFNQSMYYVSTLYEMAGNPAGVKIIRLALPVKEIKTVLNIVRWKIMLSGGMALILIAVVSYSMASRLTYPIHQLAVVAEKIKSGNYDERFYVSGSDEISELAVLLNDMLDKLKKDLGRMKKLEQMRSQFLGNVSHELRTPIFSVQGYLETLLQNPNVEPKKQQKFIKKAWRQAVRLNSLLTDLIDISRIESGEMKMTFTQFDVHEWLHKMIMDIQETVEQSVEIVLANKKNSHVKVFGDRDRLTQVMQNLVTNAVKYNTVGGAVRLGYTEEKSCVEIYVSDTGRGIDREHLPRIFERFYRVDKERSREMGGTGLGLAIVKHIIEAHKSTVHVESEIGKGSRFSFRLRNV